MQHFEKHDLIKEFIFGNDNGDEISDDALFFADAILVEAFHMSEFNEEGASLEEIEWNVMHTDFLIGCSDDDKEILFQIALTLI